MIRIETIEELKTVIRYGSHTMVGGHPLFFVTADGGVLQHKTVLKNLRVIMRSMKRNDNESWRVIGADINWEDEYLEDSHTNERIECAYPKEEIDFG